jgi:hypothetical protein
MRQEFLPLFYKKVFWKNKKIRIIQLPSLCVFSSDFKRMGLIAQPG